LGAGYGEAHHGSRQQRIGAFEPRLLNSMNQDRISFESSKLGNLMSKPQMLGNPT